MSLPSTSDFYWKDFIFKKSAHIFFYGMLAVWVYRALIGEGVSKKKAFVIAFIVAVVYGMTDEYHQSFTAGREPRIRDVLFDAFGASVTMFSINKFGLKYKKFLLRFGLY